MKFIELPLPVDDRVPEGFRLIVAYAKGSKVFIPIAEMPKNENFHNCDWEGCSSVDHVVSFDALDKYKQLASSSNKIRDDDHLMTVEDFVKECESGGFTDDDGIGKYVCVPAFTQEGTEKIKISDVLVNPSDILREGVDKRFTHVIWYNK